LANRESAFLDPDGWRFIPATAVVNDLAVAGGLGGGGSGEVDGQAAKQDK